MSAGAERSRYQALRAHLAYLRLSAAAEALPAELERASVDKLGPTAFLERLLGIEVEATEARRQASRLRFASFPAPWRLEDFDFDAQLSIDRALIEELATLRFLEEAANVLLIGPPGVGKTMLAIGLGRRAVEAGYRVYYTTAADLVARCHRAAIEGRWATTMRFLCGPGVLIVDELGYLPLPGEAAAALFQVVSRRYQKGSIILTTNRGIASWGQIFDDPMVAAAMLDRLLHRSSVIAIEGESYRMRAHRPRSRRCGRGCAVAAEPTPDPRSVTMGATSAATSAPPARSCPICRAGVPPVGRQRYCSGACRARAYRRRRAARAPELPPPPRGGVRARSVYECPECAERYLGEQRCEDCGVFCRRVGLGGACPHCQEPVAVADLLDGP